MDSSKSRKSSLHWPFALHYHRNGRCTMSSMSRYSNHTKPANTEDCWTPERYSEKRMTSSSQRNTMWRKLCLSSNVAEETTNEFYIWSNGLTILNVRTGRKNRSTTFQLAVRRNSGSFTNETQTHQGTTGMPRATSGKKTKRFFFYFYLKPREKWSKVDVSD